MKKAIHLGCGPVYLGKDPSTEWINIDAKFDNHYLAKDRPDVVEVNLTDTGHYYKHKVTRVDIEQKRFFHQDIVVDMYASDYDDLPFEENSLDEIRLVQVFEHFSFEEGKKLLEYWFKLLKKGGRVVIDVPDLDRTIEGYYHSRTQIDKNWYTRLLFGSQKNEYAHHKGMYNKYSLEEVLTKTGYKNIRQGDQVHDGLYPTICLEGYKL